MKKPSSNSPLDLYRVNVLDGIRALAILLVMWFHIWQQSWLMPVVHIPFLTKLHLPSTINLDFIPRSGYIFVDLTMLISAFCLFLPHVRTRILGENAPDIKLFYKKRAVRILPPYLLSVFIILLTWTIPTAAFDSAQKLSVDVFSTLTFTQTFFPTALLDNKINGVLWTAAIEMQFYLIFPLLAYCFRKRPLISYLLMVAIASGYIYGFALSNPDRLRMTTNQLPAFFAVFANGMLLALAYVWLGQRLRQRRWIAVLATIVAIGCIYLIGHMTKSIIYINPVQIWQLRNRYLLSLLFSGLILFSALSATWFRWLFSNTIMRFLSVISYNLYIWHQWLAVRFVDWRIPAWVGETRPNIIGDKVWQGRYTALVIIASLIAAILATYCFEKPIFKLFFLQRTRKTRKHRENISL